MASADGKLADAPPTIQLEVDFCRNDRDGNGMPHCSTSYLEGSGVGIAAEIEMPRGLKPIQIKLP